MAGAAPYNSSELSVQRSLATLDLLARTGIDTIHSE
jgi:hypothetical protein